MNAYKALMDKLAHDLGVTDEVLAGNLGQGWADFIGVLMDEATRPIEEKQIVHKAEVSLNELCYIQQWKAYTAYDKALGIATVKALANTFACGLTGQTTLPTLPTNEGLKAHLVDQLEVPALQAFEQVETARQTEFEELQTAVANMGQKLRQALLNVLNP